MPVGCRVSPLSCASVGSCLFMTSVMALIKCQITPLILAALLILVVKRGKAGAAVGAGTDQPIRGESPWTAHLPLISRSPFTPTPWPCATRPPAEGLETVWERFAAARSPSAASASWGSPAASASWAPAASIPSGTAPSGASAAPTPTSWWPGTWAAWWPRGQRPTPTMAGTCWRRCSPWVKAKRRASASPIKPSWTAWPRSSGWPVTSHPWPRPGNWPWP